MKKIAFLLVALSFLTISCNKDTEEHWTNASKYFVDNQSSYYLAFSEGNVRFFPKQHPEEILLGEFKITTDDAMILDNCKLKYSKNAENYDSILKLSNYKFFYSKKEQEQDANIHVKYDKYYYIFTDSLIQNIKDSMLVKGILPERNK